MRESRLCNAPELFQKVKESVSIQQAADYLGLQPDAKGLCLCPFHQDKKPSMKLYPDGRGFYCFSCATGGDQIKLIALYKEISNTKAAQELAAAFDIQMQNPITYREQREAELSRKKRQRLSGFIKRSKMYLKMYRILLCESLHKKDRHFLEAVHGLDYIEYLITCLDKCPEEVYRDAKAVRRIGEIEGRIADWYIRIEADGTISR